MSGPHTGQVQLKYILLIMPREARALVALSPRGALPAEFPLGITGRLGSALKILMRAHGLIASEGKGRGAVSRPNPSAFDEVRFTVSHTLRPKQSRWEEIPPDLREWRKPYAWLRELEAALHKEAATASSPSPSPQPSPIEGEGAPEPLPDLSGALDFLGRHMVGHWLH